jgi:hypothetical protein
MCSVVFDDDDLCERLFGVFEWVEFNGKLPAHLFKLRQDHQQQNQQQQPAATAQQQQDPACSDEQRSISFDAWLSVWSVLVLGDTFEQLDLAWQLLDEELSGTCTYHDVRHVAEWSHRALRRSSQPPRRYRLRFQKYMATIFN